MSFLTSCLPQGHGLFVFATESCSSGPPGCYSSPAVHNAHYIHLGSHVYKLPPYICYSGIPPFPFNIREPAHCSISNYQPWARGSYHQASQQGRDPFTSTSLMPLVKVLSFGPSQGTSSAGGLSGLPSSFKVRSTTCVSEPVDIFLTILPMQFQHLLHFLYDTIVSKLPKEAIPTTYFAQFPVSSPGY